MEPPGLHNPSEALLSLKFYSTKLFSLFSLMSCMFNNLPSLVKLMWFALTIQSSVYFNNAFDMVPLHVLHNFFNLNNFRFRISWLSIKLKVSNRGGNTLLCLIQPTNLKNSLCIDLFLRSENYSIAFEIKRLVYFKNKLRFSFSGYL